MRITTTELLRSSQSWDGVTLPSYPAGKAEVVVRRLVFEPGATTAWHHHTVINYGIVEQGSLTIVCQDGTERTFRQGEALVEMVGRIHRGENRGTEPVILDMFYVSTPGKQITVEQPEQQVHAVDYTIKHGRPHQTAPDKRADERLRRLITVIDRRVLSRKQIMSALGLKEKSRKVFVDNYLKPAFDKNLVEFAWPGSPTKPEQAYRLTPLGLAFDHK